MPTLPPSANGDGDYRGGAVGDSKPGFDYRLNEDDSLRNPYNATVEKEAQQGVEVGYPPGDQQTGGPGDVLGKLVVDPEIAADTEAAEALRANANVKVRKMGKVARSLNAQSVRKVAKRLTLRGQSGNRRGKPPRIPPGMKASKVDADGNQTLIYAVAEGEDESAGEREEASNSSRDSLADDAAETHRYAATADNQFRPSDEQGSTVSPHDETEGSKTKKDTRHSSMIDDAKDIPAEVVAATMEAGRKLMGALDPHNMLQVQRWRRKNKKGGKKKRKSYVKGKVIDGRHELYTLSIAVMLGVRTSIARTNTIIASSDRKKMLVPQDFMAEEKYEFSPKGSANTPPHKLSHTFKFKDYAPVAFAYLRRMFGVNEFDFLLSVCGNANFIEFISNAKSGQFFFYSNDGKYMIKTMTNAESKFLRRSKYIATCTCCSFSNPAF
jgi:1-phosphatidylinositol-4-phosphate 5-kinase